MSKKAYITTPIFYPTGLPHIGTAYTMFVADTLARYARLQGQEVQFLAGADEHGANIAKKAAEAGKTPQVYVDEFAAGFQKIWQRLNISHDYYIRTTDPRHQSFAASVLQKAYDNGDIYEGSFSGLYCESCEAYYDESELVEGKCPNHPTKSPTQMQEKNYYFRWSKYADRLLELYDQNPDFVEPNRWLEYCRQFVKNGLKDIPVSRANVSWGIPVPFDPSQTIYVWYDALTNYLSYLHFSGLDVDEYWSQVIHVVGKDIIKFHGILWPAMLMSAGIPLPKTVLTHGFFTINGQKIGKSNDNAINPLEITDVYGVDVLRYALLSEFQLGSDGDFSLERLKVKYQSDLSNNWGNLLNRVVHLLRQKQINPSGLESTDYLNQVITTASDSYTTSLKNLQIFEAIQEVQKLLVWGNKYISEHKPWEVEAKDAEQVLVNLYYLLKSVNTLFTPILPEKSQEAAEVLETLEPRVLFPKIDK